MTRCSEAEKPWSVPSLHSDAEGNLEDDYVFDHIAITLRRAEPPKYEAGNTEKHPATKVLLNAVRMMIPISSIH